MNIKFYKVTLEQFKTAQEYGQINYAGLYFVEDGNGKGYLYRGTTRIEGNSVVVTNVDSISAACPVEASEYVEGNMVVASVDGTDYKSVWVRTGADATEDDAWVRIDASEKIDSISADIGSVTWDNVYLEDDFYLYGDKNGKYGAITLDGNGQATIPAVNSSGEKTSVKNVMEQLFQKENQPATPTNPKLTITAPSKLSLEVGETLPSANYTVTWSDGSYTYGPNPTGTTCKTLTLSTSTEKETVSADTRTLTLSADAFYATTPASATAIAIGSATNDITNTLTALTNKGNASSPVKKITSTAPSTVSASVKVYRKMFYGSSTNLSTETSFVEGGVNAATTSTNIRSLQNKVEAQKKTFKFNTESGSSQVVVALPAGYSLTKVMNNNNKQDETTLFVNRGTVKVAGADGDITKSAASDYTVYAYIVGGTMDSANYDITIG